MTATMMGTCGATGILLLLITIANWKIFKKAGRPGWHSLIPIYNVYVQYKICWKGWIGILSLLLGAAIGALSAAGVESALLLAPIIVSILIQIVFCFKLAKAFGKGFLMGLVLMLTAGLGRLILGFGKSEYVGNYA